MSKIIIYSDLFLPTFPELEIPLYRELQTNNINTELVLQKGDYRFSIPELHNIFYPISTIINNPKKDIIDMLGKDDLCIMRFAYKGLAGDIGNLIISNKRKLLMLDPGAIDARVRQCPAQYLAVKSEWMKNCVLKRFSYKNVYSTGTIHFDQAATVNEAKYSKQEFMKSYGLDQTKKLAILTPANPAELGHQKGINNIYKQIVKIVQNECPDYQVMIKGHPLDYTASLPSCPGIIHKNEHYNNKYSWENFAPGIKVVRASEGYKAFKMADVVLNVRSSIAMETPLFPVPLLNIDRKKYTTNWPESNHPGVMKDISLNQLSKTLNDNDYFVDEQECKKYADIYSGKDIGNAYKNISKVALELI